MPASPWRRRAMWGLLAVLCSSPAAAQVRYSGEPVDITRLSIPVRIDGELNDEAWKDAKPVGRWYEFNPGDNVDPAVRSIGYLAFDDRFFYAAFEFFDPQPSAIRAPYADRDRLSADAMDYGGVFMDTRGDGRSAVIMMVTPSGVQYDSVLDEATGNEDPSPDFFWDSAARMTASGWTLEIRIPFSSLRYSDLQPPRWGIVLFRNYPRNFRYQIATVRIPRGSNCTICLLGPLVGLQDLPSGGHLVVAPYLSATSIARPANGPGSPLTAGRARPDGGIDAKWTPNADTALDFAVNPDFSQVEADVAQITANEQFALSFPEKRPFFLEGIELLATPIRAVYTRSITDPRWGARATGTAAGLTYTALVTEDAGGGRVVIPGPLASTEQPQDFTSTVAIVRARRDVGRSFVSVLATNRQARDGRGHNLVAGPDFQWRYSGTQILTAQWLVSNTATGREAAVSSHGAQVEWKHNSRHLELVSQYKDAGDRFRADTGFIPQVGFREVYGRAGWTVRPTGFVRELQTFVTANQQADRSGALIVRAVTPTVSMDVPWSGFVQVKLIDDRVRSGGRLFDRRQFGFVARVSPSQTFARIAVDGTAGSNVDFTASRPARGATINVSADLNATPRLSLALVQNQRWLDVDDAEGVSRRLFVARVSRVRGNYMFTAKSFVRVIIQYATTTRDAALYPTAVRDRSGSFSGSALFAYKINWQSVLFIGYGDDRELSDAHSLQRASRQFFAKVSYAFQR